jgi:hypothetical protein
LEKKMTINGISNQNAYWQSLSKAGLPATSANSTFTAALGKLTTEVQASQEGTKSQSSSSSSGVSGSTGTASVSHAGTTGALTPVPTANSPLATVYKELEAQYGGTPPIDVVNQTLEKLGIVVGTVTLGAGGTGTIHTTA